MSSAILFDRDEVEQLADLEDRPKRLRGSKLLWVDVSERTSECASRVASVFGLEASTRDRLASSEEKAVFNDFGRYIHVTTYSPCQEDEKDDLIAVECVVGENWVITAHDRPISARGVF